MEGGEREEPEKDSCMRWGHHVQAGKKVASRTRTGRPMARPKVIKLAPFPPSAMPP